MFTVQLGLFPVPKCHGHCESNLRKDIHRTGIDVAPVYLICANAILSVVYNYFFHPKFSLQSTHFMMNDIYLLGDQNVGGCLGWIHHLLDSPASLTDVGCA